MSAIHDRPPDGDDLVSRIILDADSDSHPLIKHLDQVDNHIDGHCHTYQFWYIWTLAAYVLTFIAVVITAQNFQHKCQADPQSNHYQLSLTLSHTYKASTIETSTATTMITSPSATGTLTQDKSKPGTSETSSTSSISSSSSFQVPFIAICLLYILLGFLLMALYIVLELELLYFHNITLLSYNVSNSSAVAWLSFSFFQAPCVNVIHVNKALTLIFMMATTGFQWWVAPKLAFRCGNLIVLERQRRRLNGQDYVYL